MYKKAIQNLTKQKRYRIDEVLKSNISGHESIGKVCTHLAQSVGISVKTFDAYRRSTFPDGQQATHYTLKKIAFYLGVSVEELSNEPIPSMETLEDYCGTAPSIDLDSLGLAE